MATAAELEFAEVEVAPAPAVQLAGESGPDPGSIGAAMRSAFDSVMGFVVRHGLAPSGPPRAIYTAYGAEGVSFIAALPVAAGPAEPAHEGPIRVDTLQGKKAYRFTHRGPYEDLGKTYNRIAAFLVEKGRMESESDWQRYMPMWEEYVNDPERVPAAELKTYIYLPVE